MQTLKEVNVQKSLEVLDDFHQSLPVDFLDKELMEKKEQAALAIGHIQEFFRNDIDYYRGRCSCSGGQKSQDGAQTGNV